MPLPDPLRNHAAVGVPPHKDLTAMNALTPVAGPLTLPRVYPVHAAETLTGGGQIANIVLHDQIYTLRITRAGKLILTK